MIRQLLNVVFFSIVIAVICGGCDFDFYKTESVTFDSEVKITHDGRPKSYPAWSPDGTQIAYSVFNYEYLLKGYNYITGDTAEIGRYELFPSTYDISPDRTRLLFNRYQYKGSNYSRTRNLFSFNLADGAVDTLMSDFERTIETPAWSMDGQQVAFQSNGDIWVVNSLGGSAVQITDDPDYEYAPSWSPDSKQICYSKLVRYATTNRNQVFIVKVESREVQQVTYDSLFNCDYPEWSPDGDLIAYPAIDSDSTGIWLMNPDGSNQRKITKDIRYLNSGPVWSPDGSKLACLDNGGDIRIYDRDGNFIYTNARFSSLYWFDEETFLFRQISRYSLIETISLIDSTIKQITQPRDFVEVTHPTWYNGGQRIAYIYENSGGRSIRSINASGITRSRPPPRRIVLPGEQILIDERVNDFDISPDDHWLVFDQGPNYSYLLSLITGKLTDLSEHVGRGLYQPSSNPWSNGGVAASGDPLNFGLHIIQSDSSLNIERSFIPGEYFNPDWSPASPEFGSHIAAEYGSNIVIFKPDGTFLGRTAYGENPSWSPDAKSIVYVGYNNELYIKPVFVDAPK